MRALDAAIFALLLLPAATLAQDEQSLADWIEQLKSEDTDERKAAARAIGNLREAGLEGTRPLLEAAARAKKLRAMPFLNALKELGPKRVPILAEALKDGDPDVVNHAVIALRHAREAGLPSLIEALQSGHDVARRETAEAFQYYAAMSRDPTAVYPAVRAALKTEKDEKTLDHLWFALSYFGTSEAQGDEVLALLLAEVARPDGHPSAAFGLGWVFPREKAVKPVLAQLETHPKPEVRAKLASALGCFTRKVRDLPPLKVPQALPVLTKLLEDEAAVVRWSAAHNLGYMEDAADALLPKLRKVQAEDPDAEVRKVAGYAVKSLEGVEERARRAKKHAEWKAKRAAKKKKRR